jgi:hypothetical protein
MYYISLFISSQLTYVSHIDTNQNVISVLVLYKNGDGLVTS